MKFLFAVIFAAGAFAEDDKVQKLTDDYTDAFIQAASGGDINGVDKFWDNNTVLNFPSELPFGGHYTKNNMTLFGQRFDQTFDTTKADKNIIAVDEAKGTALVLSTCEHEFKRSKNPVKMQIVHSLLWNTADGKLISHNMIDKDIEETVDAYRMLAEKKLWAMIWAMYKAGPEALKDGSSPVWDMISDDVQVKINMHPDNIVPTTSFNSKQELMDGMEDWSKLGKNMMKNRDMKKQVKDVKILYADDDEVFASCKKGKAIVHYTFDKGNAGLLIAEEVLLNDGLKPWDVYPFPMPMDTDDEDEDEDDEDEDHEDDEDEDEDDEDEDDEVDEDDEDEDNVDMIRRGASRGRRTSRKGDDDDEDDDRKSGRRSSRKVDDDDDDDDRKFVLQDADDDDDDDLKSRQPPIRRSAARRGQPTRQGSRQQSYGRN